MKKPFDVTFVLVEPKYSGNVGSSARAIKTCGFSKLRLVASDKHKDDEARWMAHRSKDILEQASCFASLSDAIKDNDLVIATTSDKRRTIKPLYDFDQLPLRIRSDYPFEAKVAIVFGREDIGLTNQELEMCHWNAHIPMAIQSPTLNLAQSVMIAAYIFSRDFNDKTPLVPNHQEIHLQESKVLQNKLGSFLNKIGLHRDHKTYKKTLERILHANSSDTRLLFNLLHRAIDRFDQNDRSH